jgi:hypothetical protein
VADSLRPGRGYWVKAGQAGEMILSESGVTGKRGTQRGSSGFLKQTMTGDSRRTSGTPLPDGIR